eukprot:SAG11_NODE_317_length_10836_cov_7.445469_2_plen_106_part_00
MTGAQNVLGHGVEPCVLAEWLGAGGEGAQTLALRAGEISIHDCRLAHGSPPNLSSRLRSAPAAAAALVPAALMRAADLCAMAPRLPHKTEVWCGVLGAASHVGAG